MPAQLLLRYRHPVFSVDGTGARISDISVVAVGAIQEDIDTVCLGDANL
jgi:hypothetical protein